MMNLAKPLVGLAAVAFVLAVITNFGIPFLTTAEGFSRASTNFSLLAIALVLCFGDRPLKPGV